MHCFHYFSLIKYPNAIFSLDFHLCRYIAELAENGELYIPVPCFNMISGGRHANNTIPCQEFMILPIGILISFRL